MRLVAVAEHLDAALELELLASEPYATFVYGSLEEARAISRFLGEQHIGEAAAGSVAVDDEGAVVGMLAVLDGRELAAARAAAAMALVRGRKIDPRGPVRDRMLLAGDTLLAVEPTDCYLSRIAVRATARRRGVAAWLMAQYEAMGRARGAQRLVLEVSPVHAAAVALYERCGFVSVADHSVTDPDTGTSLHYRHMTKLLT